jgi:beta-N-acetylglucosaminidase/Protein of unknown function (DUF4127)
MSKEFTAESAESAEERRREGTAWRFLSSPSASSLCALCALCGEFFRVSSLFLLLSALVVAQDRPRVMPTRQQQFAGKILLIPLDGRPASTNRLRMITRVADHDLVLPPLGLLGQINQAADTRAIFNWLLEYSCADVDGVILSIDMIAKGGASSNKGIDAVLAAIRGKRPDIPIYGFVSSADTQLASLSFDLVAAGKMDYLIATGNKSHTESIKQRSLAGRVAVISPTDSDEALAPQLLIARLLNLRFGVRPRLWFGVSNTNEDAGIGEQFSPLLMSIDARVLPATPEASSKADLSIFLHTPGTTRDGTSAFADAVKTSATRGLRIVVVDVTANAESREALFSELRARKLLDLVVSFSAAEDPVVSSATAIVHASVRLIAMKFLRGEVDQLQRAERSQIELSVERALRQMIYPRVRSKLDATFRTEQGASSTNLGGARDTAETQAHTEMNPIAEKLFSEQYQRNSHNILLSSGERIVFEVGSLQRLQLRFPWGSAGDIDIRPGAYLTVANLLPVDIPGANASWELRISGERDERLVRRFGSINWARFKANAETVYIDVNLNRRELPPEGYSIVGRKRGGSERRIEIGASTPRGAFYALGRLEQLGVEGKLADDLQLNDAPAFARRGVFESFAAGRWSPRDRLDHLQFLGRVRMNRYYYAPTPVSGATDKWREPLRKDEIEQLKDLIRAARENFVEISYGIRVGESISRTSEFDQNLVTTKLGSLAGLGIRGFMLIFPSSAEIPREASSRSQSNAVAEAQTHLINRVREYLTRLGGEFELTVVSPASPETVPDVVTILSNESIQHGELPGGRTIAHENFPSNEQKPWRLFLGPLRGRSAAADQVTGIVAVPMFQAYASRLPLTTVADYAWNPRSYRPETAIVSAMRLLYDDRTASNVGRWLGIYGSYLQDEQMFESLFVASKREIDVAEIERQLRELEEAIEGIGQTRENGLMRGELLPFISRTRARIVGVTSDPAFEKLPDGRYRRRT